MYLVFDTGGTRMRMAYSPDGRVLEEPLIFPTPQDFAEAMEIFAANAAKLTRSRPVKAVAGGFPGPMNEDRSVIVNAPNIPGWVGKPIRQELARITKAPVHIENDTTMVGLGEIHKGAGQGFEIVVYLTVSTGIGGKRFVNGQVEPSAFGFEPGHMVIDLNGFTCNCGLAGHLEGLASGNGVKKRYGQAPEDIKDPAVWEEVSRYLAAGINNITVMWSPHCIILGGSMMRDLPIGRLQADVESLGNVFKQFPVLKLAELGDLGGLEGALAYLKTARPAG